MAKKSDGAKMTIKKTTFGLVVIFFMMLWSTASFAAWSQEFYENGIFDGQSYKISKIEVFDLGGTSDLNGNGLGNFEGGKWTVDKPNSNYVVATNSANNTKNFNWTVYLTGDTNSSVNLAYLVYTKSGQVFGQYLNYNYNGVSGWSVPEIKNLDINDPMFNRGTASTVPVPPAILLLGTGLFSLVGLRKKLKA